ncbi:SfnB family sulfur acquisition oxidoreductase [Actinomadura macra]|uniref:SfnB family sulfur acquisition oxidoreductase n=1 Tax=Actinomadura macra TaxID=46164 RepID=UPI00082A7DBA|nr:SfnB family sulfur acquisition oxidoreductase [Actinomadura macra]
MAHRIRFGAEATEIARKLAVGIAEQADDRDRDRRPPAAELAELSDSGLLGITVPARHGGAEVSLAVLTEVFRTLAAADASLAQIPQSHFVFLDALRRQGTREQQAQYFARALDGARFANAQTERGGRTVTDDATTLRRSGRGRYVLDGVKYYSTGALFADVLVVRAVLPDEPPLPDGSPPKALAYIDRDTRGVVVEDDWDGMGQRTTASGTVRLDRVRVHPNEIIPYNPLFEGPTTYGARAQVLHAALDAGIARGALAAAVTAAGRARPWFESDADTAAGDPLLVQRAGELELTVRGAEALLREAAETIDAAERAPSADATARASIATAAAKVATGRAALEASSALFELGGTRSAAGALNLSRYWRDARTHTLHDPERWKVQHIGRWLLTGTPPPRHGQL